MTGSKCTFKISKKTGIKEEQSSQALLLHCWATRQHLCIPLLLFPRNPQHLFQSRQRHPYPKSLWSGCDERPRSSSCDWKSSLRLSHPHGAGGCRGPAAPGNTHRLLPLRGHWRRTELKPGPPVLPAGSCNEEHTGFLTCFQHEYSPGKQAPTRFTELSDSSASKIIMSQKFYIHKKCGHENKGSHMISRVCNLTHLSKTKGSGIGFIINETSPQQLSAERAFAEFTIHCSTRNLSLTCRWC